MKQINSKSTGKPFMKTTAYENDSLETIGLCHVGMYAKNPATLAEFYRDVMGMQIVGGSGVSHPMGASAFLTSRPREESHERSRVSKRSI
jgi:hypothetical protein